MNPFLQNSSERLLTWRSFRQELSNQDEMAQLESVAKWVSYAPTSTYVLDYDSPHTWPTPWELLSQGDFDDVAKAYLMEQMHLVQLCH